VSADEEQDSQRYVSYGDDHQAQEPPDIVIKFNALLLDGNKVLLGNRQSDRHLLIIWDEDVGEDIGTGEAILSDGKVGDGFDCAKHTSH